MNLMRSPQEQDIHDKVVADSARSYLKVTTGENIKINPADTKDFDIEGKYPDVIIKLPSEEIIIEEVETESTVTEESLEKWRDFSTLGHELRILVPLSKIDKARELTSRITIPVKIQAYEINGDRVQWFGKN